MVKLFDKLLRDRLLEVWDEQVLFNQRTMNNLIKEFAKIKYYDEEIFTKLIDTIICKNKIQNLYFFDTFHNFMNYVNENPKFTLYGKLNGKIKEFEDKHYSQDFQWRYCNVERRIRTHKELVARRDDIPWEDHMPEDKADERSEREKKRLEAEQQRKYAVYNEELFLKEVKKLMDEGKSMIEMMVYLDVDEDDLQNAFSLMSKKAQIQKLEELRKQNKLPLEGQTV